MYRRGEGSGAFVGSCLGSGVGVGKEKEGSACWVGEVKNGAEALRTSEALAQVSGVS